MTKLVKLFIIFGPVQQAQNANKSTIKVLKKYANQAGQSIDESLMSTLCLPQVEFVDQPKEPRFQTFLVTKEDGQMLYGSGLIVYEPVSSHQSAQVGSPTLTSQSRRRSSTDSCTEAKPGYASFCYTLITGIPFIHATRSLLDLLWEKKCDDNIIRCIMNIPLPARRACLRIVPPPPSSFDQPSNRNSWFNSTNSSRSSSINTSTESSKNLTLVNGTVKNGDSGSSNDSNTKQTTSTQQQPHYIRHKFIDDIYLYRGLADLPILDYPLRELFSFLQIDDLLLAFACILMEFRTLIISQDNYKLMMVGETLTTLLLPLKWCNVYVPILPPEYGATYLDAPTSYIMGINTQVTELPENLNHIQCRIYCDESRVVCDADSLALPLFLNDIKKDILKIFEQHHLEYEPSQFNSLDSSNASFNEHHHQRQYDPRPLASSGAACLPLNSNGKPFTYLDDLKFNRAIRVLFINTIRKNILANYERYIVDVPESSKEIRQFDIVSYLSDQPEFMHTFLSKFLETQLFVSFIDENAKRIQQSWLSIFDMDPDELSEHFTDEILELAFKKAQRVQLKNLAASEQTGDIEIKTVPASPLKLRHRLPALTSLKNRLQNLATTKSAKFASSQFSSIDQSDITGPSSAGVITTSPSGKTTVIPFDLSAPVIHRNSIANISLKGHLKHEGFQANGRFSPTIDTVKESNDEPDVSSNANFTQDQHAATIKNQASSINRKLNPVPNGKILELINEVKVLTKGILIDSMGPIQGNRPLNKAFATTKQDFGSCDNIALIGSLCDLIERVWAHGAFSISQDTTVASCPLWNHLMAFAKLKFLALGAHQEFSDGSHLNVLSPPTSYRAEALTELDMLIMLDRGTLVLPNKGGSGGAASNAIKSSLRWFKQGGKRSNFDRANGVMNPASRELVNDLIIINKLQDVKTGFGKARAFIRLSLERKSLCKHLKTLLSDQSLLEGLYKPYAFLMHDDEREQFLMYLLTLNTVDLPCFTSTFVNVINSRRMRLTA